MCTTTAVIQHSNNNTTYNTCTTKASSCDENQYAQKSQTEQFGQNANTSVHISVTVVLRSLDLQNLS